MSKEEFKKLIREAWEESLTSTEFKIRVLDLIDEHFTSDPDTKLNFPEVWQGGK